MYIYEVIIDGFKSYAQRTVVSGFDPQFNAITGLNGTGKSNILDSICFVLGISNLSQVSICFYFYIDHINNIINININNLFILIHSSTLETGSCWKLARARVQARSGWCNQSYRDYCV